MALCIGVDVGGTNTDAVILHDKQVLSYGKVPTTRDVTLGVKNAIQESLAKLPHKYTASMVKSVNIGTTHFVNAVIERRNIVPVAVLRLCGPVSVAVPPLADFPKDLREKIGGTYFFCQGGYEYDGREITKVDQNEVINCVEQAKQKGIKNFVICGVFSSFCNAQELQVADIIKEIFPESTMTLSHTVGRNGLLERENASILNECLRPLCSVTVSAFQTALNELELGCPFFLTQNDGTIIRAIRAMEFPVLTISSGPTNSMRGAMFLSEQTDAIVIDIGGTTTDVGVLCKGFPREASIKKKVGGVNTNFQMPDVLSIGLGGGSIIKQDGHKVEIGPESVGFKLTEDALAFGGKTLTATDVAIATGLCDIDGTDIFKLKGLDQELLKMTINAIIQKIETVIDMVKTSAEDQPVVLVGGGSVLIDSSVNIKGVSQLIKPSCYQVANAVGAALNQVSGAADKCFYLNEEGAREQALEQMKTQAKEKAVENGADPSSVKIGKIEEIPVSYLPGNLTRIHVVGIGDMAVDTTSQQAVKTTSDEKIKLTVTSPNDSLIPEVKPTPPTEKTDTVSAVLTTCELSKGDNDKPSDDQVNTDPTTGEWILNEYDVECISIGAGILGCGGGGNPYIGYLRAKLALQQGKKITVIHPSRVQSSPKFHGGWIPLVAMMGAPVILIEKLTNGQEICQAVQIMKTMMNTPKIEPHDNEFGVKVIQNVDEFMSKQGRELETPVKDEIVAIICAEVGGFNAIEPLLVGAELGVPVIDVDCMGRAFPELQMIVPSFNGCESCPAVLVADNGKKAAATHANTFKDLENTFRERVVWMGCAGGVAMCPLRPQDICSNTVPFSISRAWRLGAAVISSRKRNTSPVSTILEHENGKLLSTGKIVDVQRYTKGGFNIAVIRIEGINEYFGRSLHISVQNENLLAYEVTSDGTKTLLVSTPDLISVVDAETGEPIPTEEVKYGLRVSVIGMPCDPIMQTPRALQFVGPKAFGFDDVEFVPLGDFRSSSSVCPE